MENSYFDFIEQIPENALDTCGKEEKEYDPFLSRFSHLRRNRTHS